MLARYLAVLFPAWPDTLTFATSAGSDSGAGDTSRRQPPTEPIHTVDVPDKVEGGRPAGQAGMVAGPATQETGIEQQRNDSAASFPFLYLFGLLAGLALLVVAYMILF